MCSAHQNIDHFILTLVQIPHFIRYHPSQSMCIMNLFMFTDNKIRKKTLSDRAGKLHFLSNLCILSPDRIIDHNQINIIFYLTIVCAVGFISLTGKVLTRHGRIVGL